MHVLIKLFFTVIPDIAFPTPDFQYIVNEGMAVTFNCDATGIPVPDISWLDNNFVLLTGSRVTLSEPSSESVNTSNGVIYSVSRQLTLSNASDFDSGLYYCQASNGNGTNFTVNVNFELFVRGN